MREQQKTTRSDLATEQFWDFIKFVVCRHLFPPPESLVASLSERTREFPQLLKAKGGGTVCSAICITVATPSNNCDL